LYHVIHLRTDHISNCFIKGMNLVQKKKYMCWCFIWSTFMNYKHKYTYIYIYIYIYQHNHNELYKENQAI
jgi:hypothetical protein